MSEVSATAAQIQVSEVITILTTISNKDYPQFRQLERIFVLQHGVEVWENFLNFRLLPALDKSSNTWLLAQFAGAGIVSAKKVE